MIHNASIEQYREPVGAVTKGEEVKLRLFALEGTAVTVELVLYSEDYHKTFSMREKKGFYECIIEMPEKRVSCGIISGSQREITRTITEQGRDGPAGKEFG